MTDPSECEGSRASLARMIWFDGFAIQEGWKKNWHSLPASANDRQGTENRLLRSDNKANGVVPEASSSRIEA